MRNIKQIIKSEIFWLSSLAILVLVSGMINTANSATLYPAGSMLQPNDVTSSHIRQGVILDEDISTNASISGTKITPRGTTGTVLITDGTNLATTTVLKIATSTADLYVFGGKIHATSTNFNGVNYTWPSTDGTSGQILSTNGANTLSFTNPSTSILGVDFTAGETLNTGDALTVLPDGFATTTLATCVADDTNDDLGKTGFVLDYAQSITPASDITISAVSSKIRKVNSPTDNIVITIETDNANTPSGASLATSTISGAVLTTGWVRQRLGFNKEITLTGGVKYWVHANRSGADDGTNYYGISIDSTSPTCTLGNAATWNGSAWSNVAGTDMDGDLVIDPKSGHAWKASANLASYANGFIGFAVATTTTGNTASVIVNGTISSITGLTPGSQYYLANATGTISTTAGTNSRKIGIAIGLVKLLITNIW